jgi:mRNA interferase MazF
MSTSYVFNRGDVYIANLDPQKGSEQGGVRPVFILQIDVLNRVGNTVIVIPFTTNLKRAKLPSALLVPKGEGGLFEDSVALCHQIKALDKSGLQGYLGTVSQQTLRLIEDKVRFTLGL